MNIVFDARFGDTFLRRRVNEVRSFLHLLVLSASPGYASQPG